MQINVPASGRMNIARMTPADEKSAFVVEALQHHQLRSVFVLMRFAMPELSFQAWLRFARPLTVGPGLVSRGVLVVRRAPHVHPVGAACFRRHTELNQPGVLMVDTIVSIDHFSSAAMLATLLCGIDRVAARLGCASVRVMSTNGNETLAAVLVDAGHTRVGVTFVRPL